MLRGNPQILNANRNNRELWRQPEAAVGVMEQNGERRWDTEWQIPQIRRASEPLPSGLCAHGVSICEGVERPLFILKQRNTAYKQGLGILEITAREVTREHWKLHEHDRVHKSQKQLSYQAAQYLKRITAPTTSLDMISLLSPLMQKCWYRKIKLGSRF